MSKEQIDRLKRFQRRYRKLEQHPRQVNQPVLKTNNLMEETKQNQISDKMDLDNTEMAFEDNTASIVYKGKLGADKSFDKVSRRPSSVVVNQPRFKTF